MSRQWKPGDVATFGNSVALRTEKGWAYRDGGVASTAHDLHRPRPLVVIDPEDREQVERLAKAVHESDHIATWHDLYRETRWQIEDATQAALRSLTAPEKPEEPLGLGAVVESADGGRWVRSQWDFNNPWTPAERSDLSSDSDDTSVRYAAIAAVTVLSEGVTQ